MIVSCISICITISLHKQDFPLQSSNCFGALSQTRVVRAFGYLHLKNDNNQLLMPHTGLKQPIEHDISDSSRRVQAHGNKSDFKVPALTTTVNGRPNDVVGRHTYCGHGEGSKCISSKWFDLRSMDTFEGYAEKIDLGDAMVGSYCMDSLLSPKSNLVSVV
jgi:hypothetical protein